MNGKRKPRILIVDDEKSTRDLLRDSLSYEDYEVVEASGGTDAIRITETEPPDLVILDIMMPPPDGMEVLRHIRHRSNMPVIMLSGKVETEDKILCLDCGADDYVTKPFVASEVSARLRTALRRSATQGSLLAQAVFDDGYLRIDLEKRVVTVSGRAAKLTKSEYALLHELVKKVGGVVEYKRLSEVLWGEWRHDTRDSLYHHLTSLRNKIEPESQNPRYIINHSGVGYRFNGGGQSR